MESAVLRVSRGFRIFSLMLHSLMLVREFD